ncbi:tetratricopeptide repeat protein [Novosphingobium flavum]|uniref:Tetratricopeptide repeat protein n=1 Tax=Novosphingobium flavum TaxID=1778672 RepID=A0A7X1FPZ9_9SPHN|nr:tetratricopeptide repeat protein [Novosphingobium flavum]MBC2664836.1 tetratricopeptide repeat protein [Novosphingobium flavum]
MICRTDRIRPARLVGAAALGLVLAAGLIAASPGGAVEGAAAGLVRQADAALGRSDGIAAEMALRKAMAAGLPREAAAARMGEAFIDQRDPAKARKWLAPGQFSRDEALRGFRLLGQLEMNAGNLAAAGRALDRALAIAPGNSGLWLDIARLRYAGGEQVQSVAAAQRAVELDPGSPRVLQYRGLMVRDRFGLAAGLPWFEAGLKQHPNDLGLLSEYAATLGEIGRAREMVAVTRRMIELDPGNGRALFLQAVLAARAGDVALARRLLGRVSGEVAGRPSTQLLQGIVELEAGNARHAAGLFDALSQRQPQNRLVRLLLARSLAASGEARRLVDSFSAEALRPDASPYLQTLVARAYEDLGQRDQAAPFLDRAARGSPGMAAAVAEAGAPGSLAAVQGERPGQPDAAVPYARALLGAGQAQAAAAVTERLVQLSPGSAESQIAAGDLRLMRGDLAGAVDAYRISAAVRLGDDLLVRLVEAYGRAGLSGEAEALVGRLRASSPHDRTAMRLAAGFAARRGDWAEAAALLRWLSAKGGGRDARIEADLAFALLRAGDGKGAMAAAGRAWAMQPAGLAGTGAMALVLGKSDPGAAQAFTVRLRGLSNQDANRRGNPLKDRP